MIRSEVRGGGRKSMPQQLTAWPFDPLNIGNGISCSGSSCGWPILNGAKGVLCHYFGVSLPDFANLWNKLILPS